MKTFLVTDGTLAIDPERLLTKLSMACEAGIDAIQLRENVDDKTLFPFVERLRKITADAGVRLFINGRVDVALAVSADGVHLSESALSPDFISQIPETLLVGASVHSLSSAEKAQKADFFFYGAIFDTGVKKGRGLESLKAISESVQRPIYAVGGITPERIPSVLQAGAAGIAAISFILQASDIGQAVRLFKAPFICHEDL